MLACKSVLTCVQGWSRFMGSMNQFIQTFHKDTKSWKRSTVVSIEAEIDSQTQEPQKASVQYGELSKKFRCSIVRPPYKRRGRESFLRLCEDIKTINHPNILRPELVLLEKNVHIVHEDIHICMLKYIADHHEEFFVVQENICLYVTPLFQKLFRELILATKELDDHGLKVFPSRSNTFVYVGKGGTISVKLSPFHSDSSDADEYIDKVVGTCAEVMVFAFKDKNYGNIQELQDLIKKAKIGKWWNGLEDLFGHPFFWISEKHVAFLDNCYIYLTQTVRPSTNPLAGQTATTTPAIQTAALVVQTQTPSLPSDGLNLFASVFKDKWVKLPKPWHTAKMTWLSMVPNPPSHWKAHGLDDFELIRLNRNLLAHHNEKRHYSCGKPWGCRREYFLHHMNLSLNISVILYDAVQEMKEELKQTNYKVVETINWKVAVDSLLH